MNKTMLLACVLAFPGGAFATCQRTIVNDESLSQEALNVQLSKRSSDYAAMQCYLAPAIKPADGDDVLFPLLKNPNSLSGQFYEFAVDVVQVLDKQKMLVRVAVPWRPDVSGPILYATSRFKGETLSDGMRIMITGMFNNKTKSYVNALGTQSTVPVVAVFAYTTDLNASLDAKYRIQEQAKIDAESTEQAAVDKKRYDAESELQAKLDAAVAKCSEYRFSSRCDKIKACRDMKIAFPADYQQRGCEAYLAKEVYNKK